MDIFCANITEDEAKQNYEKRLCDQAFQSCRKAERDVASQVESCREEPQGCSIQGNLTQEEAAVELATAQRIKGELDKTEKAFDTALQASGKAKGPGDDGKLPSLATSRQADGAGCTLLQDGKQFKIVVT